MRTTGAEPRHFEAARLSVEQYGDFDAAKQVVEQRREEYRRRGMRWSAGELTRLLIALDVLRRQLN